jgi:hypothetical protein
MVKINSLVFYVRDNRVLVSDAGTGQVRVLLVAKSESDAEVKLDQLILEYGHVINR